MSPVIQRPRRLDSSWDAWTYPPGAGYPPDASIDITGYEVRGTDGRLGTVTEAVFQPGGSYIIADTGGWIFPTTVMIPTTVIAMIGTDRTVHVDRTNTQITIAPQHDPERRADASYHSELANHYKPA